MLTTLELSEKLCNETMRATNIKTKTKVIPIALEDEKLVITINQGILMTPIALMIPNVGDERMKNMYTFGNVNQIAQI